MSGAGENVAGRWGFLSGETAGRGERRLAWAVAGVSLLGFAAGLPFVRVALPALPAFIPAYEGALCIIGAITAFLLFTQASRLGSRALVALGAGYLFDSCMAVAHALSFPGAFAPAGLIGGGPQTTAWLYMFWHGGFPLFVLAYALLARRPADALRGRAAPAIAASCAAAVLLAAGLTLLATAGHDLLPVVMRGRDYTANVLSGRAPAMWATTVVVLVVLWRRSLPTVLEVWLMVVLLAWLLDVAYAAVLGAARYDLGFYAGRLYGLLAASLVLLMLLAEMTRLYRRLGEALATAERQNAELARSREEFAQVQRFEAIGQLVGGVAHDFNNILTVIAGGAELTLRSAELGPRERRLQQAALSAAKRGERITQQLLTFARRQMLRPELLDPNEVIEALGGFIRGAVGEQVRLSARLGPDVWPVRADRTQFETALVNLVVNSRDAMENGGEIVITTENVALRAGEVAQLATGDYVRIAVSDSGPGIDPEIAARAFEPFFTTKQPGKGSGLGLAQVYGFARGAEGGARIRSHQGEGATVEIFLPRAAAEVAAEPSRLPLRQARGAEAVLVVEDDPEVLQVAVNGLLDLGYQVRSATHAAEALAILREHPDIDLLFSDIVMPGGMNGVQLAVEARRIRPSLKVLLTSGYAAAALAEQHGLPDTLGVLPKPYKREELASRLKLVMNG